MVELDTRVFKNPGRFILTKSQFDRLVEKDPLAEYIITDYNDFLSEPATRTGNGFDILFLKSAEVDAEGKINRSTTEWGTLSLAKAENPSDATRYAATYELKIADQVLGKIDIPKDLVLSGASTGIVTEHNVPYEGAVVGDKYIELSFNTENVDSIYIPLGDLLRLYTFTNGLEESATGAIVSIKVDSANANGLTVSANGIAISLATTTSAGALSAEDKTKLDSLDAGNAYVTKAQNASDAGKIMMINNDGELLPSDIPDVDLSQIPDYISRIRIQNANTFNLYSKEGAGVYYIKYNGNIKKVTGSGEVGITFDSTFTGTLTITGDWNGLDANQMITASKDAIVEIEYDINIRDTVDGEFSGLTNLKYISLPRGINLGHKSLFKRCSSLEELTLESDIIGDITVNPTLIDSAVTTNNSIIYGCSSLKKVVLKGTKVIAAGALSGALSLTDIELPESLITISDAAFAGNSSLKRIVIPTSVRTIGGFAFASVPFRSIVILADSAPVTLETTFAPNFSSNNLGLRGKIFVKKASLAIYKSDVGFAPIKAYVFPIGGFYKENITLTHDGWDADTLQQTISVVGETADADSDTNVFIDLADEYEIECISRGVGTLTFQCSFIPGADITGLVKYQLAETF